MTLTNNDDAVIIIAAACTVLCAALYYVIPPEQLSEYYPAFMIGMMGALIYEVARRFLYQRKLIRLREANPFAGMTLPLRDYAASIYRRRKEKFFPLYLAAGAFAILLAKNLAVTSTENGPQHSDTLIMGAFGVALATVCAILGAALMVYKMFSYDDDILCTMLPEAKVSAMVNAMDATNLTAEQRSILRKWVAQHPRDITLSDVSDLETLLNSAQVG